MRFKQFISVWAFLALALGQLALADHNASHLAHELPQAISIAHNDTHDKHLHADHKHENGNHQNHGQDDNQKHECPECLFAKTLQHALLDSAVLFEASGFIISAKSQPKTIILSNGNPKANAARAPPTFLI